MTTVAPMLIMAVASYAMSQASKPSMPTMPTLLPPPPTPEPIKEAELAKPADTTTPGDVAAQRRRAIAANKQYTDNSILGLGDQEPNTDITKAIKLGI